MNVAELATLIGSRGLLTVKEQGHVSGFRVPVQVVDVKMAYGRRRLLVSPLYKGHTHKKLGQEWVSADRVDLIEEADA